MPTAKFEVPSSDSDGRVVEAAMAPSHRSNRRPRWLAGIVIVVGVASGACTSKSDSPAIETSQSSASSSTTAAAKSAGVSTDKVDIKSFAFTPESVTVKAGTAVTWTNQDDFDHTVTADDNSFDAGHVSHGKTFSKTFDKPGTFTYHCAIHNSMTGTVTVQ